MNLFALMHAWPEFDILLAYAASTALSISASFRTTKGSEPPSSKHPFFTCFAQRIATSLPPSVLPVNLHALTRRSARIYAHWSSVTNMFAYSPLPNPASVMASEIAFAQSGVDGECLSRMEFPIIIGGITDLKGNQNGKFHGITTIKNEIRLRIRFQRSSCIRILT